MLILFLYSMWFDLLKMSWHNFWSKIICLQNISSANKGYRIFFEKHCMFNKLMHVLKSYIAIIISYVFLYIA